jgi:Zn-dependent membrane protease YugP
MTYYVVAGIAYLFSLIVKKKLDANYRKWGGVRNSAGVTGAGTARRILDANEMRRVPIEAVAGKLSDHYDPRSKTLRLSEAVYATPSVAAMAIAAHEAGHAIQDHVDYKPMEIRTVSVPLANAGARFGLPAAIAGSFLGMPWLVQVGVLAYVGALFLQFLTLPVEFNASKRALQQLDALHLVDEAEEEAARSVLRSAAMTYVAGVASSAGYILYLGLVGGRSMFRKLPPVKPRPPV